RRLVLQRFDIGYRSSCAPGSASVLLDTENGTGEASGTLMSVGMKNVAVLGSTGSIGRNALEVIAASRGRLRPVVLSAFTNAELLIRQACEFRPALVVAADPEVAAGADWSQLPAECKLLKGPDALVEAASLPEVDVVLTAIVGSAGLRS